MADISKITTINGTTYDIKDATARQVMTGATAQANGSSGQVPAPTSSDASKFLRGDGTWQTVSSGGGSVDTVTMNGTTYSPTSGNINLGTVITDVSGKADKADTVLDTTLSKGRKANTTIGTGSLAFGNDITASGNCSVATGLSTKATTSYSHAEGRETTASGTYSHAEGGYSSSRAQYSHAEGNSCFADGIGSHAEGSHTEAIQYYSHSEGEYTNAVGKSSHVSGRYNVLDSSDRFYPTWTSGTSYQIANRVSYEDAIWKCVTANEDIEFDETKWEQDSYLNFAEIVGMGSSSGRCNARAVDWKGNEYLFDDLYIWCDANSTGGTPVSSFAPQIGEIRMWAGDTAPDKWMICDGSLLNRSGAYFPLFGEIGTLYGGGDGLTTFAIPNFNGRSPIGVGDSGTTGHTIHSLGTDGGEESHILSVAELASHGHSTSVSASAKTTGKYKKNAQSGTNTNRVDSDGTSSTSGPYTTTVSVSVTVNNNGSSSAHNNMSPYCTVNFIIYTGVSAT